MKLLSLSSEIFVVHGKSRSCIYDFVTNRLFHISNTTYELISSIARGDAMLSKELSDAFKRLGIGTGTAITPSYIEISPTAPRIDLVSFEVTQRCNLACSYCYNALSNKTMDFSRTNEICEKLREIGCKRIHIIGGEPLLLGSELKTFITALIEKTGAYIEIVTNGFKLDNSWAKFFRDKEISIALSVKDGFERFAHKAVDVCKKWELRFRCSYVKTKNSLSIPEIKNLKVDIVRLCGHADFSLFDEELFEEKTITINNFRGAISKEKFLNALFSHNCFGRKIYVDSDFNVFPCSMERQISLGNLFDNDLLANTFALGKEYRKDEISRCRDCEFRYTCHDCRPNRMTHETKLQPWFCLYNPETGLWKNSREYFSKLKKGGEKKWSK